MCPRGSPACERQKAAGGRAGGLGAAPGRQRGWPRWAEGGAAALQAHLPWSRPARSRGRRARCARARHRPHGAGRGRVRTETVGEERTSTAGSGAKPQNHLYKVRCQRREHTLTLPQSERPDQAGTPGWQQLTPSTPLEHTVSSGHPQGAGIARGPRGHREMAEDLPGKWHERLALTGSSGWSRATPGSLGLGSRVRSGRRLPSPAPTHSGGTQGTAA